MTNTLFISTSAQAHSCMAGLFDLQFTVLVSACAHSHAHTLAYTACMICNSQMSFNTCKLTFLYTQPTHKFSQTRANTHAHTHTRTHTHTHTLTHTRTHTLTHTRTHTQFVGHVTSRRLYGLSTLSQLDEGYGHQVISHSHTHMHARTHAHTQLVHHVTRRRLYGLSTLAQLDEGYGHRVISHFTHTRTHARTHART